MSLDSFDSTKKQSILLEDIEINGDITSKNNLTILGHVTGKVECEQDLNITGEIEAEIKGGNIKLQSAAVKGDVYCDRELSIDFDSSVTGNIKSGECTVDGKINGNVEVDSSLHIQKNAEIVGNIEASEVSLLQGAKVDGQLKMTR